MQHPPHSSDPVCGEDSPLRISSAALPTTLAAAGAGELLESPVIANLLALRPRLIDQRQDADARNAERLAAAKREILGRIRLCEGEALNPRGLSPQVAESALHCLRTAHLLLGLRQEGRWRYPEFQLDERGAPCPEIAWVIRAFGPDANAWDVLQWFLESNPELEGETPLAIWPHDRTRVVTAAEHCSFGRD
jgi:hypothetical protein